MSTAALDVYNPLPLALQHYSVALLASLPAPVREVAGPGVEVAGQGPLVAAARLAQHLGRLHRSLSRPLLELWPVLGHWETAALRARRAPVATVWHDPDPLRNARGHGRAAHRFARAQGHGVIAVAHSQAAQVRLHELGYTDVVHVPHPVRLGLVDAGPRQPVARVLGQFKSERDLALMVGLAPLLDSLGVRPEVLGRGWPRLAGWSVTEGFLSEAEFRSATATASVVVIPYARYWQSGVALRALECGTPVVGPAGGHLAEVLGDQWPGLVDRSDVTDPQAWADAVERVLSLPAGSTHAALEAHDAAARTALRGLYARMVTAS